MSVHCFTSMTYAYWPRARILGETLKKHNPSWSLHAVLCEPLDASIDVRNEPFDSIISLDQLTDRDLSPWLFSHDVTEACTGVKPWAFKYLINTYAADKLIYLDPDIAVFAELGELPALLDQFPILLTPHRTETHPESGEHWNDTNFLRCGVFNLGFLALHNRGQGSQFLDWWESRVSAFCYDDPALGLFTDQRWCDLAPVYFDGTHILRDPGYNLAPWNISGRQLARGRDGTLGVNGAPLRLFHFSKYGHLDYKGAALKQSSEDPLVEELVRWYSSELSQKGEDEFTRRTWRYDRFYNGATITRKMRRYYRQHPELQAYFPDPFDSESSGSFLKWWEASDLERAWEDAPYLVAYPETPCRVSANDVERSFDRPGNALRQVSLGSPRPPEASLDASVIIPASGNPSSLAACLAGILGAEQSVLPREITVIGPGLDASLMPLPERPNVRFMQCEPDLHLASMCNRAAEQSTAEYVAVLDERALVHNDWLPLLYRTFLEFPRTGLACSRLIDPISGASNIGADLQPSGELTSIGAGMNVADISIGHVREVDVPTQCFMVPTALWRELGGMRLDVPQDAVLLDLSVRLHQAGYETRAQPHSMVSLYRWYPPESAHSGNPLVDRSLAHALRREAVLRRVSTHGRVLYVDDRMPQPDRSAGGAYSFYSMRILRDLGFQVTFIPQWHTSYRPDHLRDLQSMGIEVQDWPFIDDLEQHLETEGYRYDLVILCRPLVAERDLNLVRRYCPQAAVVFNTIDLHFLRLERIAQITGKAEDRRDARQMRDQELQLIARSDATIVVSDAEQRLVQELVPSANIALVPIPVEVSGRRRAGFEDRRDIVYLGGYDHRPNLDAVQYFVREIWPIVSERLPGVKFVVAGHQMPSSFASLASHTVDLRGYVRDLSELYNSCRLSVVPLRMGAGVKGKILTSMSYGVPNVVSSLAAEGMQLIDGEQILVADQPREFAGAVERVYRDPHLWQKLSDNGLEYVRTRASVPYVTEAYKKLLASLNLAVDG